MNKINKIKVWQLEKYQAEYLAKNFIKYVINLKEDASYNYTGDSKIVTAVLNQDKQSHKTFYKRIKKLPVPRKDTYTKKFKLLIHLLIIRNYGQINSMNANILSKMLGSNYKLMLLFLKKMEIISINPIYKVNKSSMNYELNPLLKTFPNDEYNKFLIKKLTQLESIFDKYNEKIYLNNLKDSFLSVYDKKLSLLKLTKDIKEINDLINKLPKSNHAIKIYSKDVFNINNKRNVCKLDKRNRIYSIISNFPKILRNFLNIKFIIDTKNSQPLLFSYYIIKKYKIPFSIIIELNQLPISNLSNHHDLNKLHNSLSHNSLEIIRKNKIPTDVLRYIQHTSQGVFWEDFMLDEKLPRSSIKVHLFREVFFSKRTGTWKASHERKFSEIYPNVYKFIKEFRFGLKNGTNEHVAHIMTRLESKIFHEILMRLWEMNFDVLNIHDAVVPLNTQANQHITEDAVKNVMKSVYEKYNLIPTFSIEHFSIEKAEKELNQLLENKDIIDEAFSEIEEIALNPDAPDHEIYFRAYSDLIKGRKTLRAFKGRIFFE